MVDGTHSPKLSRSEAQRVQVVNRLGEGPLTLVDSGSRKFEVQCVGALERFPRPFEYLFFKSLNISFEEDALGRVVCEQAVNGLNDHCFGDALEERISLTRRPGWREK